jgi:hypothetical protein
MRSDRMHLPITDRLSPGAKADMCLVTVRREQITDVMADLVAASAIRRIVFMVNHANVKIEPQSATTFHASCSHVGDI